jgi:hypothetical protein
LLFGEFLMQLCAFFFLEDISGELPPYEETYLSIAMDAPMLEAYRDLEDDIRKALKAQGQPLRIEHDATTPMAWERCTALSSIMN